MAELSTQRDFDHDIRINQSIEIVRGMPVLIFGNPTALVMIAMIAWSELISSYAFGFAVCKSYVDNELVYCKS